LGTSALVAPPQQNPEGPIFPDARPVPLHPPGPLSARWRPAAGHRRADGGARARRPLPDPARRHRLGEDDDDGQRHRHARSAHARALAQQDARGAALRRAQELLPAERGRVLHLVLRLLPAGSVRPHHGHVHREGRLDQRGHRPAAAARHVEPDGARGRDHRGDRLRDLRPRRPGVLSRAMCVSRGENHPARRHPAPARRHPVLAQRCGVRARHLPRARRHGRDPPGLRGAGGPHRDVGRRGRAHHQDRSAHRRDDRGSSARRSIRPSTSSPRAHARARGG
jgi:hypothetical protein